LNAGMGIEKQVGSSADFTYLYVASIAYGRSSLWEDLGRVSEESGYAVFRRHGFGARRWHDNNRCERAYPFPNNTKSTSWVRQRLPHQTSGYSTQQRFLLVHQLPIGLSTWSHGESRALAVGVLSKNK
jgi:hypothetical protein